MLTGRYFRDENFLQAPVGNNSSQTWKSIVWGRTLFKESFKWRVGNEKRIVIDEDPWLIRQGNRAPILTPQELRGKRVKELIRDNGEWNEPLIKRNFLLGDAEDIISIPVSQNEIRGEIIWNPDSKGVFSVRSAYNLAYQISTTKEASGSSDKGIKESWRNLRELDILPR